MNRMRSRIAVLLFLCSVFTISPVCFGDEGNSERQRKPPLIGCPSSVQVVSGILFSPILEPDRMDFDFIQANVRLGWLLQPEKKKGTEIVFEVTNSGIIEGPGDYMGGIALLLRYNFDLLMDRVRPFVQAGAGVVYTDAYKDRTQDLIGQSIEFTLRFGAGLRFKVHRSWSFDVEGNFEHISNAGMAERNVGVNAFGGMVGLTYYFSGM